MNKIFCLSAPLVLLLSACGEKGKDAAQGSAGGEVLEGSISDAMVPLDTVRSQPPLAQQSGEASDASSGTGDKQRSSGAAPGQEGDDSGPVPAADGAGEAPAPAAENPAATPDAE